MAASSAPIILEEVVVPKTKKKRVLSAAQKRAAYDRASLNRRQRADARWEASWSAPIPVVYNQRRREWHNEVTKKGRAYFAKHQSPPGGFYIRGASGLYAHPEKVRRNWTEHYNREYGAMVLDPARTKKGSKGRTAPAHTGAYTDAELRAQVKAARALGYKPKPGGELKAQAAYARSRYF